MSLPSIAYVDEQADERDNFFIDAFDSELFENIHLVDPRQDINETIAELLDLQIDALVTDFNLTDTVPLNYSGEDLVAQFLSIRANFPCFIRTSYEEDALKTSADVNRVYSKDIKLTEHAGRPLFQRISLQIERHQRQIAEWQEELAMLLEMHPDDRTAIEIETIIELDTRLEISMSANQRLSRAAKEGLFGKRDELAKETERLIAEMKRALGDDV